MLENESSILIVEDDPKQAERWRKCAVDAGFTHIDVVGTEAAAYEMAAKHHYSVSLVDTHLTSQQNAEGLRVIRHMRNTQPEGVVIGKSAAPGGVRQIHAGASDFFYSREFDGVFVNGSDDFDEANDRYLTSRLKLWRDVEVPFMKDVPLTRTQDVGTLDAGEVKKTELH